MAHAWLTSIVVAAAVSLPLVAVCLSIHVTLGWLRLPDLSVAGAYLVGAFAFAAVTSSSGSSSLGFCACVVAGMLVGGLVALLHFYGHLNSLLAGLLVAAFSGSLGARIGYWHFDFIGGSPAARSSMITMQVDSVVPRVALDSASRAVNQWVGLQDRPLPWGGALLFLLVAGGGGILLNWMGRSRLGTMLRATGDNRPFAQRIGLDVRILGLSGLAVGGALSAFAGAIAILVGPVQVTLDTGKTILVEGFLCYFLGYALVTARSAGSVPMTPTRIAVLASVGPWLLSYLRAVVHVYANDYPALEVTDYPALFVVLVAVFVLSLAQPRREVSTDDAIPIY